MYKYFLKRYLEFVLTLTVLLLLFPMYVLVIFFALIKLGRPVFFKQSRPGINGKVFNIYKLRTMTNECNTEGILLPDKNRLTKFGQFLRSSSLDELPGLLNVLNGSMSLIGPRPLLVEYLPLYSKRQARRHEVRPGITGWAQVNGRNAIGWNEKFEMDIWYVDNQSFSLDIKILWMTVKKVITQDGIGHKNNVTMDKFKG
ncbi:sugar transferase, partial [Gammaproteobacteria bacterium]|nr:sugar transferase [Gammaproteobacteria bacterium]